MSRLKPLPDHHLDHEIHGTARMPGIRTTPRPRTPSTRPKIWQHLAAIATSPEDKARHLEMLRQLAGLLPGPSPASTPASGGHQQVRLGERSPYHCLTERGRGENVGMNFPTRAVAPFASRTRACFKARRRPR
jgi:hypothetical protein